MEMAVVVALLLVWNAEALDLMPQTGGSCRPFPETEYCGDFGLAGVSVFMYDGVDLSAANELLATEFSSVERAAQSISTPECLVDFKSILCSTWFPVCGEDGVPRKPCKTWCQRVHSGACESTFSVAKAAGMGHALFECEGDVIGDAARLTAFAYAQFLDTWDGLDQFEAPLYTDMVGGVTKEVMCLDGTEGATELPCDPMQCKFPQIESRYPLLADPLRKVSIAFNHSEDREYCAQNLANGDDLDCTRCFSFCELPCPYPAIYEPIDYTLLSLAVWVPGVVALPLNVVVLASEWRKVRAIRRSDITDCNPMFAAAFSVAFFMFDTLPTLTSSHLRCNGHPTFSVFINSGGPPLCRVAMLKVHILQALMFTIACTLFKVRKQLVASKKMSKYRSTGIVRIVNAVLVFGVPAALSVCTVFLQADQLFEVHAPYRIANGGPFQGVFMHVPNNIRYMETCGPKFATAAEEVALVQAPLIVAGALCVGLSISLVQIVRGMGASAQSAASSNSALPRKSSAEKSATKSNGLYKIAVAMLRFALISTLLVLLNVVATLVYHPKARQFGIDLTNAEMCIDSGINLAGDLSGGVGGIDTSLDGIDAIIATCGDFRKLAPPISLLLLLNLASSLTPLGFGFVFAIPAIKQLKKSLGAKVRPSMAKTAAASTAPTDTAQG